MRIFVLIYLFCLFVNNISYANSFDKECRQREDVDEFVSKGPVFLKNIKRLSEYKKIAKIISENVEYLPSKYNSLKIIKYYTFVFEGLEIRGIDSVYKDDEFSPIMILISSSKWPVYRSLTVGQPKDKITDTLGHPDSSEEKKDTGQHQYEKFDYCGESDCVYFIVLDGKIDKVEFVYYND